MRFVTELESEYGETISRDSTLNEYQARQYHEKLKETEGIADGYMVSTVTTDGFVLLREEYKNGQWVVV